MYECDNSFLALARLACLVQYVRLFTRRVVVMFCDSPAHTRRRRQVGERIELTRGIKIIRVARGHGAPRLFWAAARPQVTPQPIATRSVHRQTLIREPFITYTSLVLPDVNRPPAAKICTISTAGILDVEGNVWGLTRKFSVISFPQQFG